MEKFAPLIYNLAYRMVGNGEDAQDLTQETFIKVLRELSSFRRECSLSTWIYRIATNLCLSHLRKRKIVLETVGIRENLPSSKEDRPDRQLLRKEMRELIHKGIEHLPEENRTVIILRDFQGLSYRDIARILKIPLGTVQSRLSRGRLFLKDYLKEYLIDARTSWEV